MANNLAKKSILLKTSQVAVSTIISRGLALVRTGLQLKYFGAGALSDAFNAAYTIPNRLRKVFAEGAISAAFIPDLVKIVREGQEKQASKLMTLMLFVIETLVLIICSLIFIKAKTILLFIAPGFKYKTIELETAVPLLRILIFFIFFISSSSLLTAALQAKNQFFIPSWGSVLLNIFYISGLILGIKYNLDVKYLAFFIILGGLFLFLLNLSAYFKLGFNFSLPDKTTFKYFGNIMAKFLPCIITMSAVEINFTIDGMLASFLPAGSYTLFDYASGFFRIPLGVFAVAFSTILLSHFSRISTYAPKRLSFYLLESSKFVFWITIPVAILMSFFSYKFFYTLALYSGKLTLLQVQEASRALQGLLLSLFFISLNKVLLTIYYSLNSTFLPTVVTLITTIINTLLNLILIPKFGIFGISIATSIGETIKTVLFVYLLNKQFNFKIYLKPFLEFVLKYILQLLTCFGLFYFIYNFILNLISNLNTNYVNFLTEGIGFWIWASILSVILFGLLYLLRKKFKLKVYFLD